MASIWHWHWANPFTRLIENKEKPEARLYRSNLREAWLDTFSVLSGPMDTDEEYQWAKGDDTRNGPGVFDYLTGFIFYGTIRAFQACANVERGGVASRLGAFVFGVVSLIQWPVRGIFAGIMSLVVSPITWYVNKKYKAKMQREYADVFKIMGENMPSGRFSQFSTKRKMTLSDSIMLNQMDVSKLKGTILYKDQLPPTLGERATGALSTFGGWLGIGGSDKKKTPPTTTEAVITPERVIDSIVLTYEPDKKEAKSTFRFSPSMRFWTFIGFCCPGISMAYTMATLPEQVVGYTKWGLQSATDFWNQQFNPDNVKFVIKPLEKVQGNEARYLRQQQQIKGLFDLNIGGLFAHKRALENPQETIATHPPEQPPMNQSQT